MVKAIEIKVTGIKETTKYLKRKNNDVISATEQALYDAGNYLRTKIKESIKGLAQEPRSVDTGAFLQRVYVNRIGTMKVKVESGVPYSVFLEEGTRYIKARKHFVNTAEREQEAIVEMVQQKVNSAVKK